MKIKLYAFDIDGTLVNYNNKPFGSTWDALIPALKKEKREKWISIRDKYLNSDKKKYKEWFESQVALLKGLSLKKAEEFLFPIPYLEGADSFLNLLKEIKKEKKFYTALISCGINIVAEKIKKDFSIDFLICSELFIENGVFTGKGEYNINLWEKEKAIEEISQKLNIKLEEICYFGDSDSDINIFNIVGLSIAINPKSQKVSETALYTFKNFKELLSNKPFLELIEIKK